MDRRKLIEYGLIVLLIIALAVLIWFLLLRKEDAKEPDPTDPDIVRQMPRADQVFTAEEIANGRPGPEVAGRIFAERFGSYSNQSGYGNIGDVLTIVTPELRAELESLRVAASAEMTESFYAVNTRIIGVDVIEVTDTTAKLTVQTQREEEIGNPGNTRVKYQKIDLELQQVDGVWLIASYAWEE